MATQENATNPSSTMEAHRPAPLVLWKKPPPAAPEPEPPRVSAVESALASMTTQHAAFTDTGIPAASKGISLSAVISGVEGVGVYEASCFQRLSHAGSIQGVVPLTPGESFKIKVLGLGTFAEIGIGLSAPRAEASDFAVLQRDMVGWSSGEVGLHGDHGSCYAMGHLAMRRLCPPWVVGDVVECGLTPTANVFFKHNSKFLIELPGRWQITMAHPTVTLRSTESRVEIDLRGVARKPLKDLLPHSGPHVATGTQGPLAIANRSKLSALSMLSEFKRTTIPDDKVTPGPGVTLMEKWFGPWCSCETVEVHQVIKA
eukprot:TRINITY_DN50347_c0_g1_i1.p1 TRINITY_DN50347_c0_g1~~TRINITY_DN50347_c0_g1_i1.p1  ORF type:complete len:315 (+),score=54.82 TRINITY_DN50347_c0_g1_i1:102-1046(+)